MPCPCACRQQHLFCDSPVTLSSNCKAVIGTLTRPPLQQCTQKAECRQQRYSLASSKMHKATHMTGIASQQRCCPGPLLQHVPHCRLDIVTIWSAPYHLHWSSGHDHAICSIECACSFGICCHVAWPCLPLQHRQKLSGSQCDFLNPQDTC